MFRARSLGTLAAVTGAVLWLAACGGEAGGDGGSGLSGSIQIDGSSTVFPISEAVAEEFMIETGGDVRVTVGVSGTGGGFKRFCTGETDISNASREISQSEIEQCRQNGVNFLEIPVATDGISIAVNPDNDFVGCLTVEELRRIWEPNSSVRRWSEVRPDWPDTQIRLYGPGTDSGTFDYFTEAIMGEEDASRADYTASEDDNVLVQGVAGDGGALGYFGYAYYAENADQLKLVAVDDGDGCVEPTPATIESGEYAPLSRPMFIYVSRPALERPAVEAFVRFYLENAPELVPEVGYVRLGDERYREGLDRIGQGGGGSD